MMPISWADFEAVEIRAGTIVEVEDFPEAKKPAWKLTVDFGPEIGTRRSSARARAGREPDGMRIAREIPVRRPQGGRPRETCPRESGERGPRTGYPLSRV
jgi:hypothetical protein